MLLQTLELSLAGFQLGGNWHSLLRMYVDHMIEARKRIGQ